MIESVVNVKVCFNLINYLEFNILDVGMKFYDKFINQPYS